MVAAGSTISEMSAVSHHSMLAVTRKSNFLYASMVLLRSGAEFTMFAPKEMSILSGCSTVTSGSSITCSPMCAVTPGNVYFPVSSRSLNIKVPSDWTIAGCSVSVSSKPLELSG